MDKMELEMNAFWPIKKLYFSVVLGLVILHSSGAFAFPGASPCMDGYSQTMNTLFEYVSIRDNDGRVTFEDQAQRTGTPTEILYRNYPTRRFYCGEGLFEANVVGSGNVILISAHAIYNENCNLRSDAQECVLNDIDGTDYEIDLSTLRSGPEKMKKEGAHCSLPALDHVENLDPDMQVLDWAVVKLKKKVKNVKPYKLRVPSPSDQGSAYTVVAAAANNFGPNSNPPQSIQSCQWRDTQSVKDGRFYMKTDCDTGGWMSGAPMLNGFVIEGISNWSTFSKDGLPYDSATNFSISAPVTAEMLKAVEELSR